MLLNKFSIILPVRNGGHHVKECVNGILAQTNTDFNLLVLDNNSTDGTLQWISALDDRRIIMHPSSVDLSMVDNWARIKEIEKGEFITLIGHDDILHPHYLSEMEQLIARHPDASLYQTHFSFIDVAGKFIRDCMPMDEIQYGHEFLACQLTRTMDSMGTGYMMRSKDYDRLGGIPTDYPNLIFADYELWVKLSLISYKATSGNICFSYRIHNSVSKSTNGENYKLAFEKYIRFIAALGKENEQVRLVNEKYGHDMLMYFCESLSHRLIKTPEASRKTKVAAFIKSCKDLAAILIPGQPFEPNEKFRIKIASQIDSNFLTRSAFYYFKKLTR